MWRFLQGASFAGIYMPSIKAISDVLPDAKRSRGGAMLTSSYAMGPVFRFFSADYSARRSTGGPHTCCSPSGRLSAGA